MKKISVRAGNGNYEVQCGRGALRELPRVVSRLQQGGALFVVSSPRVWRNWGVRVSKLLGKERRRCNRKIEKDEDQQEHQQMRGQAPSQGPAPLGRAELQVATVPDAEGRNDKIKSGEVNR